MINYDIWGAPGSWDTVSAGADIKVPVFGNDPTYKNTIVGGIEEGVFEWDGAIIDNSFAPWGINKHSALANPNYVYIGANVGATYDSAAQIRVYKRGVHTIDSSLPFLPCWRYLSTSETKIYPDFKYQYTPYALDYSTYKAYSKTAPIMSFKYNNIIVVPWVMCCKDDDNQNSGYSFTKCSVKDYFDGVNETYPYISSLYIKAFYFGDKPNVTTARTKDSIDYNNDRATISQWYGNRVDQQTCSWDGNFTNYLYAFWTCSSYTYQVICGVSPANPAAMSFGISLNQDYTADDSAFARWSYQNTILLHGVRGDMFDYDYKRSGGTVYVTAKWQPTIEDIMRELAYYGFWFTLDEAKAQTAYTGKYCIDDDMCIPVFNEQGITTGDYKTGTDAAAIAPEDEATPADFIEYDPTGGGGGAEGDVGDLDNITVNRFTNAGGLKQYVVNQITLIQLTAFLNGTYLPTGAELDADFKGTNPQEYIVSVQKYPFDLPNTGDSATIYVGKIGTGLTGYPLFPLGLHGEGVLPINHTCTYDFGEITLNYRNYNDFRDYQSKLLLFLPFIGTAELDPRLYMYHTLGLLYTIDYNTGATVAEIKRDGLTMETKTGNISITVPFMAANMGAYQNQLAQLDYSKQMTKIKGIQTALSTGFQIGSAAMSSSASGSLPGLGNLSAITTGAAQLAANATTLSQLDYQINHTAPSVGTLSTASAANAWFMDPRARLVIVRPFMPSSYDARQYSHTIGNACCKTGKLSDFSGFTVAASAVLDRITTKGAAPRAATEQELQILRRELLNGIYL